MKIIKKLKNITFEYDDEKKILTIRKFPESDPREGIDMVEVNKVYMFSLMRLWIRITQKEFRRRVVPKKESWVFSPTPEEPDEFVGPKEKAIEHFSKKYKKDKDYIGLHLTPF